jgi:hypothetical protein
MAGKIMKVCLIMKPILFLCSKRLLTCLGIISGLMVFTASGATITWTNLNGGNWSASTNWSPNIVPRSIDTVQITTAGTYTVTIDTAVTIVNLTLGNASGTQTVTNNSQTIMLGNNSQIVANGVLSLGGGTLTGGSLTLQGTFNWAGATVVTPVTVSASGVLNFGGVGSIIQGPLTNSGTINWSGPSSSLFLYNNHAVYNGVIYNQATGLFNLQNDQSFNCGCYGFEVFNNAGTVRKTAGTGVSTFGITFTNTGTVDAQSGTIHFTGGGNVGGTYNTASGAFIEFNIGNYTETGTPSVTGLGTTRLYGGTVTLNDRIAKFVLVAGNVLLSPTFEGSGTIQNLQVDGATLLGTNVVTGTLGMNGGALGSASPLTVAPGGVLNFNGTAVTVYSPVTNSGTINWSGGAITVYNNNTPSYTGIIYNQPAGLFNIQNDQACNSAGYGFETFRNLGTVRKSAGVGITTFSLAFTNSGTVDAQTGTIRFANSGNLAGTYNTAAGAVIEFTGGSFLNNGAVSITGTGICRLNGSSTTVTLNDRISGFLLFNGNVALTPTFQTNGTIQNLQLNGAYLTGTNTVTGTLGIDGGGLGSASALTVAPGGVLNFNGAAVNLYSPLTNSGTINWSGNSTITVYNQNNATYNSTVYNQSTGLFNLMNDQTFSSGNYGFESFRNAGIIRKTAGVAVSTFSIPFTNSGTIDAQTGTIRFAGGGGLGGTYNTVSGTFIQFDSGNFIQTGAITVTGSGVCRLNGANATLSNQTAGFLLSSGNVTLAPTFETDGTIHNLQLNGAYLTGTNTVTGTLGIDGGGLGSASALTVAPGGVLNFNGAAVNLYSPLTNSGTINWSGNSTITVYNQNNSTYNSTVYNQSTGLFNLMNDQTFSSGNYGFESFRNAGIIRKTAGLALSTFSIPFTNSGTVDAQTGIIRFTGGGGLGGTYNTVSGTFIQFDSGNFVQTGPVTITGSGICRLNGANANLSNQITGFLLSAGNVTLAPAFEGDGTIHSLQLDGAFLLGINVVTGTLGMNGGGLGSASALTVTPAGVLNFNGAALNLYSPLTNSGTINWTGSGAITIYNNNSSSYNCIINNQPSGLFNIQCDQSLSSGGYGSESITNSGTFRKTAGVGTTAINIPFSETGTLDVQSGIISFSGAYSQIGGTMNFGITSLANYGKIAFSANAPFTGTLSVNFNSGYSPSAGDAFNLVSYTTHSNIFTSLSLPSSADWLVTYGDTLLTLSVLTVHAGAGNVTLTPISNRIIDAGTTLLVTNTATDTIPTNVITYSLTTAPPGASIGPANGILQWRAPIATAGTVVPFTVKATDNGIPPASDSKSFNVTVNPIAPVTLHAISYVSNHFTLRINGFVGPDYTLQSSTNLINWNILGTSTPTNMPVTNVDNNALASTNHFYRVLLGP